VNTSQGQSPIAAEQLLLLEKMPVPLAAVMMQQVARADRLFPVERSELDRTLHSLIPPRATSAEQAVRMFATLRLSPELLRQGWRSDPAGFVERMTAELWSTGQIEAFRDAAKLLAPSTWTAEEGTAKLAPRFGVIVLDRRLRAAQMTPTLFRKLRPYGTFFPNAGDDRGMETLERWIGARESADPASYAHWKISGDFWSGSSSAAVVSFSYDGLRAARQQVLARFNSARNSAASGGPEGLRQQLLHQTPEQIGLNLIEDPILRTFAMDIFTEGSGTQLYSTTFVQWTIREALRRAQPRTLLARFTPRSEPTSIDFRITHPSLKLASDGAGSLVDAEMGAYLSYLNLMRLPDSKHARFLVWHEGYGQALAVGGGMPQGAESASVMKLEKILDVLA
jgi:hypothetical protein